MKIEIREGAADQDFGIGLNLHGINRRIGASTGVETLVNWTVGRQARDAAARNPIDRREISTQKDAFTDDLIFNERIETPDSAGVTAPFVDYDSDVGVGAGT